MPPTPQQLGALLKAARQRAGLSLNDLAARSGMSRTAIHLIEKGSRENPGFFNILTLAGVLEAEGDVLDWLARSLKTNAVHILQRDLDALPDDLRQQVQDKFRQAQDMLK